MSACQRFISRVAQFVAGIGVLATLVVFGVASPAGALAPQPIDASTQGPLAFVAMTVMIVIFVFTLFYMDRIRKRHEEK